MTAIVDILNEAKRKHQEAIDTVKGTKQIFHDEAVLVNEAMENISNVNQTKIKSNIKDQFGEIFYGVLCPINGHSLNGRRFSDGSSQHRGYQTPHGPAVHQKIGNMTGYSSKTNWYGEHEVFDGLKQEHVDLIVNGKKARKDNQEIAQELLDYRDEIQKLITTNTDSGKINLTKPVDITVAFVDHNEEMVTEVSPASLKTFELSGNSIDFEIIDTDFTEEELEKLSMRKNESISFNIGHTTAEEYQFSTGYWSNRCHFYVIGAAQALNDIKIRKTFDDSVADAKAAELKFEELKNKWAGRLITKGLF